MNAGPAGSLGLSAAQALEQTRLGNHNRMPRQRDGGALGILRRNTLTLFNLLNICLALALLWADSYRNMLFLGVILSNTLIGLVQELRAKRAHDRLQLLAQGKVRVLRDEAETKLPPDALVLGDVVFLIRGDQAPADAQVLEGACQADESLLTGEGEPVPKAVGDALWSGSFVTEGAVTARLTAVGAHSYAGGLQMAARKVHRPRSELMGSMRRLIRRISLLIVPMGALMYWKHTAILGLDPSDSVVPTVAAMLGMIPEGLVLLTSMALAVGVIRLARAGALVNELFGIETLARTDVVCMDKTGTLTTGALEVRQIIPASGEARVRRCLEAFVAASKDSNPTQDALKAAINPPSDPCPPILHAVPFSSDRKWAAIQFAHSPLPEEEGVTGPGHRTLVLGAPERVLSADADDNQAARAAVQTLSAQGFRVLALGASPHSFPISDPPDKPSLPPNVSPLGLVCFMDSLRPQVRETVRYFGEQDVVLKVISGDHPLTVISAAEDAGVPEARQAVDMSVLDGPIDYDALCGAYTVFGRVSPQDKRELIEALKRRGHGVAMIGDGVNDIPALKAADCSIAMAGGSDAAQRVAQITLLDGGFSAMPRIVAEGRRVINNITRAAALFLVKNIYSFLLTAALLALPFAYPLAPIQMTLISAATIGIPSFVLAMQPCRDRVRGRFLTNVMLCALPGGIIAAGAMLALCSLRAPLGLGAREANTLCALAAGYTGLWCLLLACLPLNRLRAALVAAMGLLLFGGAVLFPDMFYFTAPIAPSGGWAAAGLLAGIPLCLWGLTAAFRRGAGLPT